MVETRRTCSMKVGAALMAMGCSLSGTESDGSSRVTFVLAVPQEKVETVEHATKLLHDGGYGLQVDLGEYERARNELRDKIDESTGGRHNGRRRT